MTTGMISAGYCPVTTTATSETPTRYGVKMVYNHHDEISIPDIRKDHLPVFEAPKLIQDTATPVTDPRAIIARTRPNSNSPRNRYFGRAHTRMFRKTH
jgi:hypothetical protein